MFVGGIDLGLRITDGGRFQGAGEQESLLTERPACPPVQQQVFESQRRLVGGHHAQDAQLASGPEAVAVRVERRSRLDADELQGPVDIARFGKRHQQCLVGMVARLGDDRELARRLGGEPGSLHLHLDAPPAPVGEEAGQDENIGVVRVLFQVGLIGLVGTLFVLCVAPRCEWMRTAGLAVE